MSVKTTKQEKDASSRLLTNGPRGEPTHDKIALCAYSLWEQQGRLQNQEIEIWLQAQTRLREPRTLHGARA